MEHIGKRREEMSLLIQMATERFSRKRNSEPNTPVEEKQAEVPISLADFGPVVQDPRPDLPGSQLWMCILAEATGHRDKTANGSYKSSLCDALYTIRKVGAVIEGGKIVPVIGTNGWKSENDFREVANRCLRPRAQKTLAVIERARRLKNTLQRRS